MAANQYLKPMLDAGSPRVFNCNEMTQKILAKDPEAPRFFRNKQLNTAVLIKDTVPLGQREKSGPAVGTKLYFPFNEANIYEGGRTIFLHEKSLTRAIMERYGEGALPQELLAEDLHILSILDHLPSLDPFLLKDAFMRAEVKMNESYFEVTAEAWAEIEAYMLQRFEPVVKAAFPDAMSSDDKARQLMDKIWEARDLEALMPLIVAFRLPQHEALDLFSSWRGIVYYSYQYGRVQLQLVELMKWLVANDVPITGRPVHETKEMTAMLRNVRDQLRAEWKIVEGIIRKYEDGYDKMFRHKTSSAEFLAFLKGSNKIYWELGNALGKVSYGIYCWDVLTARFAPLRKLPWAQQQEVMRLLNAIYQPDPMAATAVNW
ncbi:MAG: hypothetical protein ACM30I_10555 [Gemmatimonas sp.]